MDSFDDKSRYSISVFFPCYNEVETLDSLVRKSLDVLDGVSDDYEVIIVDDGSSDGTAELADGLATEFEAVRVVRHEVNTGYGGALQSGFKAAAKEFVFYTDGDSQFDIGELPDLLPMMETADIVSCYRLNRQEGFLRKLNAWCWGKLVCVVFGMRLRDIDCAFKLYRREIFDNITILSTGALIDAEILARANRKGYRIVQKGVKHYPRTAGSSTGANLAVILRAFRELFKLRKEIVSDKT